VNQGQGFTNAARKSSLSDWRLPRDKFGRLSGTIVQGRWRKVIGARSAAKAKAAEEKDKWIGEVLPRERSESEI